MLRILLICGAIISLNLATAAFAADDNIPPPSTNTSSMTLSRVKRQYGCPSNCFSSCNSNSQCRIYQVNAACIGGCCCPQEVNLDTACSGTVAVAGCINNLCGQGYFCSPDYYCCRCSSGATSGPCVNNLCPAGYACNTNDYCCPIGTSAVLDVCVNGLCPTGYECGAGNLCYQSTLTG